MAEWGAAKRNLCLLCSFRKKLIKFGYGLLKNFYKLKIEKQSPTHNSTIIARTAWAMWAWAACPCSMVIKSREEKWNEFSNIIMRETMSFQCAFKSASMRIRLRLSRHSIHPSIHRCIKAKHNGKTIMQSNWVDVRNCASEWHAPKPISIRAIRGRQSLRIKNAIMAASGGLCECRTVTPWCS